MIDRSGDKIYVMLALLLLLMSVMIQWNRVDSTVDDKRNKNKAEKQETNSTKTVCDDLSSLDKEGKLYFKNDNGELVEIVLGE